MNSVARSRSAAIGSIETGSTEIGPAGNWRETRHENQTRRCRPAFRQKRRCANRPRRCGNSIDAGPSNSRHGRRRGRTVGRRRSRHPCRARIAVLCPKSRWPFTYFGVRNQKGQRRSNSPRALYSDRQLTQRCAVQSPPTRCRALFWPISGALPRPGCPPQIWVY